MQREFLLQSRYQVLHGVEQGLKLDHVGQTAVVIMFQDRLGLEADQIHHHRIRTKTQFRKQDHLIGDRCTVQRDFAGYLGEVSLYFSLRQQFDIRAMFRTH